MDDQQKSDILDRLELLQNGLLDLEKQIEINGDLSGIHILFRNAHNLKSTLSLIQSDLCATLIHKIEHILDRMRNHQLNPTIEFIDQALKAADQIALYIHEEKENDDPLIGSLIRWFEDHAEFRNNGEIPEKTETSFDSYLQEGYQIYRIEKLMKSDISEKAYTTLPIFDDIREAGKLIEYSPDYSQISRSRPEFVMKITFASLLDEEKLSFKIFDPFKKLAVSGGGVQEKPQLKFLVVEDEFTSMMKMQKILVNYGYCDSAVSGKEAVSKYKLSHTLGLPYQVIFLDIMLPDIDGLDVLKQIRDYEIEHQIFTSEGVRVIMITSLKDYKVVQSAFQKQCDAYLIKPVNREKIEEQIRKLRLI